MPAIFSSMWILDYRLRLLINIRLLEDLLCGSLIHALAHRVVDVYLGYLRGLHIFGIVVATLEARSARDSIGLLLQRLSLCEHNLPDRFGCDLIIILLIHVVSRLCFNILLLMNKFYVFFVVDLNELTRLLFGAAVHHESLMIVLTNHDALLPLSILIEDIWIVEVVGVIFHYIPL